MSEDFLDEIKACQKDTCTSKAYILFDYHDEIKTMIENRLPLTKQHMLIQKKTKEVLNYKVYARHVNKYFPELLEQYGFKYKKRRVTSKLNKSVKKVEQKDTLHVKKVESSSSNEEGIKVLQSPTDDTGELKNIEIDKFNL